MGNRLRFSGHESFHCRHFWLKKGFDFNEKYQGDYNIEKAVVELGIGKNMVSAMEYWLKSFGIVDEETKRTTELANKLLADDGWDPFLENQGTLWLLQYYLLKTDFASLYRMVFSEYRKERVTNVFNQTQIKNFLKSKLASETLTHYNENTANKDFKVFIKNYIPPAKDSKSIEDDFSALFIDLGLISQNIKSEGEQTYKYIMNERKELPTLVFLFAILDTFENDETSISFTKISDALRDVFMINNDGIEMKMEEIKQFYPGTTFSDKAGISDLQIKGVNNKWDVLKRYYEN